MTDAQLSLKNVSDNLALVTKHFFFIPLFVCLFVCFVLFCFPQCFRINSYFCINRIPTRTLGLRNNWPAKKRMVWKNRTSRTKNSVICLMWYERQVSWKYRLKNVPQISTLQSWYKNYNNCQFVSLISMKDVHIFTHFYEILFLIKTCFYKPSTVFLSGLLEIFSQNF